MKRIVIAFLAAVLAASSVAAQEEARAAAPFEPAPIMDSKIPCPFPETITIAGGTTATPVASEFPPNIPPLIAGSTWNQTGADKAFGHTFRYQLPNPNECCTITGGRLVLRIKALQDAPVGGAAAWNDSANVYVGGVAVGSAAVWQPAGASSGATKTVTIPIAGTALTTGLLSVYVQDDTAVVSAELQIDRCCASRPCKESSIDISTGSNNGTAIAIGANDLRWTVQPPTGGAVPAVAIATVVPWVTAQPGTRWISSAPSASALGLYVYKLSFDLGTAMPGRDCALKLQYAVDNDVTMKLDNNPPFATLNSGVASQHFTMLHSAGTAITPASGPHTLTVNVTNTSGPTGLLIAGRVTCVCKHPLP